MVLRCSGRTARTVTNVVRSRRLGKLCRRNEDSVLKERTLNWPHRVKWGAPSGRLRSTCNRYARKRDSARAPVLANHVETRRDASSFRGCDVLARDRLARAHLECSRRHSGPSASPIYYRARRTGRLAIAWYPVSPRSGAIPSCITSQLSTAQWFSGSDSFRTLTVLRSSPPQNRWWRG